MSQPLEEFEQLLHALELEKQEDFEIFRQLVLSLPLQERKKQGYTWYPLQIIKQGYTYGEHAYVTLAHQEPPEYAHHFRAGQPVRLFTEQPSVRQREFKGVAHFVDKNKMKIILNSPDLPDWLGLGLVGVDLLFDETTYIEMEKAIRKVMAAKGNRLAELRDILLGKVAPSFDSSNHFSPITSLNPSQNRAVQQILASRDVAVVHGPPGTGKTTTLVQAVASLSAFENSILVTAPSNTAVDLLTERLAAEGLNVTRIGHLSRIDESILAHTLEMKLAHHPDSKNIKKIKIQAIEARKNAQRYKRKFDQEDRMERRNLFREAGELSAWARQLEDRLLDEILDTSQVITATLVGTANDLFHKRHFTTVFIDEAAQALEPATWIPLLKASKVVFAGDPFQLPPTVKSKKAEREGLNQTLLEKCLIRIREVNLLDTQYRMHELIMGFSNARFYDHALKADVTVGQHRLPITDNHPLIFIDTAGCGFEEKIQPKYQSRYNPEEFLILREHLYQLTDAFQGQELPSIGIISPYREQVMHIKDMLETDSQFSGLGISVQTIDGFQGQERDVIYISLVRSNNKSEIGFLKDYRRMNVAMTRARKQLIVVGDSATIGADSFYSDLIAYCEKQGQYRTAWEYLRG